MDFVRAPNRVLPKAVTGSQCKIDQPRIGWISGSQDSGAPQGHKSVALMNSPAKAPLYPRSPDALTPTALERQTSAENPAVIVAVKVGCGDLNPSPHGQAQPPPEGKLPEDHTRGEKHLLLPIVGAVVIEGRIHFQLRPYLAQHATLRCQIPCDRLAEFLAVSSGQMPAVVWISKGPQAFPNASVGVITA